MISEVAVTVALEAFESNEMNEANYGDAMRAALEAAAPYIIAETAQRIADEMQSWAGPAERGYTQSFAETAAQQLPTT